MVSVNLKENIPAEFSPDELSTAPLQLPAAIPSKNNMDALRLLFASLVVFAHCYDLSLNPALESVRRFVSSSLAVQGFFILSGFLVVMSYERSQTIWQYFSKRGRRIYPAYFTVIVVCAILGTLITTVPLSQYFGAGLFKYLGANLLFMNFLKPNLPGVFDGQVLNAVNGALWTIKVEVAFYLVVPFICYAIHRFGLFRTLIVCYIGSLIYQYGLNYLYETTNRNIFSLLAKFLPGQLTYFLVGSALYYKFDWLNERKKWLLPLGIVLFVADRFLNTDALMPIGVGLVVVSVAFGPYFGNVGRYGDFSYGVYIWHFPIVQTLILFGFFAAAPYAATAAAYALALAAAVLSWHLVEKPWLFKSSHYVKANEEHA